MSFVYATNGHEIVEFDYFTGREEVVSGYPGYPTPVELWPRYRAGSRMLDEGGNRLLRAMNHAVAKGERYYQEIAVNRAVEGILKGNRRAASDHGCRHRQDCCCISDLLEAVERPMESDRRVSARQDSDLADRSILVDQPKVGDQVRPVR